jgi:hypothetical protein
VGIVGAVRSAERVQTVHEERRDQEVQAAQFGRRGSELEAGFIRRIHLFP